MEEREQQGERTCEICGGTGVRIMPIAYEDENGIVHHDVSRLRCDGCDGTGKVGARRGNRHVHD